MTAAPDFVLMRMRPAPPPPPPPLLPAVNAPAVPSIDAAALPFPPDDGPTPDFPPAAAVAFGVEFAPPGSSGGSEPTSDDVPAPPPPPLAASVPATLID